MFSSIRLVVQMDDLHASETGQLRPIKLGVGDVRHCGV